MKKLRLLSLFFVAFSLGLVLDAKPQANSQPVIRATEPMDRGMPVEEAEVRAASAKALKLIQHSQTVWYKKQTCTSCHHQLLPEMTLNLARARGVPFNEAIASEMTKSAFASLQDLDMAVQGYDYIDVYFDGWVLTSASQVGFTPNLTTAASAQFIASRQQPDGSWPTIDARPPQAHSPFAATAICAQAIRHYLPAPFKNEKESRLRQARAWLLKSQPRTTEDQVFQLLGLLWTDADEMERQKAAQALLARQREDGGWSQLPALESDAYTTGEALFALQESAGLKTSNPAYQRGLRFLLQNQQADGSWRVKSRLHPPAPVSPPYTDTEFPEQHDQFISIMGTSWAVNALLHALPPQAQRGVQQNAPPGLGRAEEVAWQRVALSGSAGELKQLLDTGLKPNARTSGGSTALMLAARDIEKVKLLLARGADVNARAPSGITALMVAARYKGNAEVVRLLLQKGSRVNNTKAAPVRNHASALFYGVIAGDVQIVEALIQAGARLKDRMNMLGLFPIWPLSFASIGDESILAEYLISKGANPNEVDNDGLTPLAWATLTNHVETIQVLLARGARVNTVDRFGMTPLLYAASIDFGDTAVIEKLIAAGADLNAKNKQGQTALDLAKIYNHSKVATLLTSKLASR